LFLGIKWDFIKFWCSYWACWWVYWKYFCSCSMESSTEWQLWNWDSWLTINICWSSETWWYNESFSE